MSLYGNYALTKYRVGNSRPVNSKTASWCLSSAGLLFNLNIGIPKASPTILSVRFAGMGTGLGCNGKTNPVPFPFLGLIRRKEG
jgi:hypothetical protein